MKGLRARTHGRLISAQFKTMRGRTSPQIALANAPADGVTCVRFASNDTVVASSWDSHVYLYDAVGNTLRARYAHRAAVLDVAPISATSVLSGGVDRELRSHDWVTGTETVLGVHDAPIRCIEPLPGATSFVSGSWDRSVKLWDVRAPSACQGTFVQPDKVFALATAELSSAPIVVVATAGRAVLILDARNMAEPLQRRESSLKTQTRCVACHIDGGGYALGSVEGRVAMEYIDASPEVQARKYAFKCHRSTSARTAASARVRAPGQCSRAARNTDALHGRALPHRDRRGWYGRRASRECACLSPRPRHVRLGRL